MWHFIIMYKLCIIYYYKLMFSGCIGGIYFKSIFVLLYNARYYNILFIKKTYVLFVASCAATFKSGLTVELLESVAC